MRLISPIVAAAVLATMFATVPAASEMMIAPTRVVLDSQQRTTELALVNRGTETAAFRIQIENRRMRADGSLEDAGDPQPGELFAQDKIRFTPRQLILEPGARQTIRITADLPPGLAAGEYRSHLRLLSAPVGAGRQLSAATSAAGTDSSLSIQLIAIRSLTIPILVRTGSLDASAAIEGAHFDPEHQERLVIAMTRSGNRSTYGDIRLLVAGDSDPVYVVRGIAIYTPNTRRDVIIALPDSVRARLAGHHVRISYVSTDPASPDTAVSGEVDL